MAIIFLMSNDTAFNFILARKKLGSTYLIKKEKNVAIKDKNKNNPGVGPTQLLGTWVLLECFSLFSKKTAEQRRAYPPLTNRNENDKTKK